MSGIRDKKTVMKAQLQIHMKSTEDNGVKNPDFRKVFAVGT